jgi:hypothetical protein
MEAFGHEPSNVASEFVIMDDSGEQIATVKFNQPDNGHYICSAVGKWRGTRRWELGSGADETAAAHNMTIGAVKIRDDGAQTWVDQLRSSGYQVVAEAAGRRLALGATAA